MDIDLTENMSFLCDSSLPGKKARGRRRIGEIENVPVYPPKKGKQKEQQGRLRDMTRQSPFDKD